MRWFTLVFSVTLFYSLSFVNAIPHDIDEKRHWLHRRQDFSGDSPIPVPVALRPSTSGGLKSESSSVVASTPLPETSKSSLDLPSSTSSSTPEPSPPTFEPPPESSSSSVSSSSSSISSSSSSSSSSTRSSTSSSSSPTTTRRPDTQDYTSYHRFSSTLEVPSDTLTANGNIATGSGSGNSFLKDKAAMGSVFAIVGLIGVAIVLGVIFFLVKKARQRKDEEEEAYFEKLPANNSNGGGNEYGLGPSATDLAAPANTQAYMSRDVHYGATNQYPNHFANYNGLEYPPERGSIAERPGSYVPGTAYAAAMAQRGPYSYEGQVEDPNSVPNHPFADPDNRRY
ncbi:hypothetical protein BDM02DRAFT_3184834 [Thelephora ganbajun]|uniref:Uncharacterized protein n=1 Tax=Thelephora ganbajun TaxID=370292 RepID=A0ACB6ZNY7_THEGA|nr:hypothetical protein BDM02DRAFT_3184834 [Thelephora ganbajun]